MPLFEFHPLGEEFPELQKLARDHLGGEDFLDVEPGFSFYVTIKGDSLPIGYATSCVSSFWDIDPKILWLLLPSLEGSPERLGELCNTVVHPAWRRRGIGERFYELRLEVLDSVVEYVYMTACMPAGSNRANVRTLAEKYGFRAVGEIPGYWSGCDCNTCGKHCTCTAVVYLRKRPS